MTYLLLLLTSVINLFFSAYLFIKNRRSFINVTFSFIALSLATWTFCHAQAMSASTPKEALLWTRMVMLGPIFTPFLFYLFAKAFPETRCRLSRKSIFLHAVLIVIFLGLVPSHYFISEVEKKTWGIVFKSGLAFAVYGAYFFITMGQALLILIRKYFYFHGNCKRQVAYVLLGTGISIIWGLAVSIILPIFGFSQLNRFGPLGTLFIVGTFSYAIVAYRLMDIEVVVKRTLVFAGLFAMAITVVMGLTLVFQNYLGHILRITPWLTQTVSIVVAFLFYEPTKKFLVKVTDRYLFQKKEEIRVILNRLAQNIITILDIDKVGSTILETLKDSLRLESGVILIQDEDGKTYEIMDSFGIKGGHESFPKEGLFMRYFLESDKILNLEDPQQRESLPVVISGPFESWRAVICIPLFIHRELIGLLILGKKKSDQEFSEEEIDCFPAVAGQVAIALSNARLTVTSDEGHGACFTLECKACA